MIFFSHFSIFYYRNISWIICVAIPVNVHLCAQNVARVSHWRAIFSSICARTTRAATPRDRSAAICVPKISCAKDTWSHTGARIQTSGRTVARIAARPSSRRAICCDICASTRPKDRRRRLARRQRYRKPVFCRYRRRRQSWSDTHWRHRRRPSSHNIRWSYRPRPAYWHRIRSWSKWKEEARGRKSSKCYRRYFQG